MKRLGQVTPKQHLFINSTADEVLFGGAAGGGKSYAQVIDSLRYAMRYKGSKQVIFRRSYGELEKSIIRTMLSVFPRNTYDYNIAKHTFTFRNGSIIDCGFISADRDVYSYQSAEYDVIRFDELTHFSEYAYTYMLSRLRGVNGFPKSMKSASNPTGIGRLWVKERFVDIGEPNVVHKVTSPNGESVTTRQFIPSRVFDNVFLMRKDSGYVHRLQNLPEKERKGLLEGEWDATDGQYFEEFRRSLHVIQPIAIPKEWRVYRALDYGLDMLACYWIAVDSSKNVYVFRELCESNLPISRAAERILELTAEPVYMTLAPPDLMSRTQESGQSKASIFADNGVILTKSSNEREAGWLAIKELMRTDANGEARLRIFSTCTKLIKHLPALTRDELKPTDCAVFPHEITHSPDALRYFAIYWVSPNKGGKPMVERGWRDDQIEDYRRGSAEEKRRMIEKWSQRKYEN